jgi:hypothetical protein
MAQVPDGRAIYREVISIKDTKRRSGGCAQKAVELTHVTLR